MRKFKLVFLLVLILSVVGCTQEPSTSNEQDSLNTPIEVVKEEGKSNSEYAPTENQNILYDDVEWSYYGEKVILPQTKELKEANVVEYMGEINRINRQSGEVENIYNGGRNYSYSLFDKYANKIYLLSETWQPFSEVIPGYFGVIDLDKQEYIKLIDGGVIKAVIQGEKGYLFANDKLMEIDLSTAEIIQICTLPKYPNYAYFLPQVKNIQDGKIYIVIDDTNEEYVVDLASRSINKI